jgi:hypothetical protein
MESTKTAGVPICIIVTDSEGEIHDIANCNIINHCLRTGDKPSINELLDYRIKMNKAIGDRSSSYPDSWYIDEILATDYVLNKFHNLKEDLSKRRRKIPRNTNLYGKR